MAAVKDLNKIASKWARVAGVSEQSYKEGIENPRKDWAKSTQDAESRYTAGVQAAISKKLFGKGVAKAGTAKWQTNALAKGPLRWSAGIMLSKDAYITGFQPYHDELSRIVLPDRGARGDPKNIQRVAAVATVLHNKKLALKGA